MEIVKDITPMILEISNYILMSLVKVIRFGFSMVKKLPSSSLHGESSKCMYEENYVGNIKKMVEFAREQYSKDQSGFEKFLSDAE